MLMDEDLQRAPAYRRMIFHVYITIITTRPYGVLFCYLRPNNKKQTPVGFWDLLGRFCCCRLAGSIGVLIFADDRTDPIIEEDV